MPILRPTTNNHQPTNATSPLRGAWPSHPLEGDTDKALTSLEAGMPVALIATFDLKGCKASDRLDEVLGREDLKFFDHIPVREGGSVVGVLDRRLEHDEAKTAGEAMRRLHQSILIAAETSLLTFVENADQEPCRLVLRGCCIEGIVTLSDLQKLAVRPVLFTLITHLELLLADWIRNRVREEDWYGSLTQNRQGLVDTKWSQYHAEDMAIDRLSCTDFCDKRSIALRFGAFARKAEAKRNLKLVEKVRNSVAHAGDYALTVDRAQNVAAMVRAARSLIDDLRRNRQPQTETILED